MESWDWYNCTQAFDNCVNESVNPLADTNVTTEMTASVKFIEFTRFWIHFVISPPVIAFGVLSNLVTMIVLTRRRMRSSTNMYLTALAASDFMYLLLSFSMSLEHMDRSHNTEFYYYWEYRRIGIWLTDATNCTSIWLTVSFTVERYIAVCHPLRGKVFCTESRARAVILTVYILSFLATCTTAFEWQTVAQLKTVNNITSIRLSTNTTPLGENQTYKDIFAWFTGITIVFVPLFLLALFNSYLIHAVHRSQKQRCKMTQTTDQSDHTQSQENRITVTLIAVVILFLVCQIPQAITFIYSNMFNANQGSTVDNILRGLGSIFNFLVTINASCNFILYCALSDKYRRTFLITFLSCWHRAPSQANSLYYNNSMHNTSRHASVRATNNLLRQGTRHHTNNNGPQSNEAAFSRQPSLNVHQNRQLNLT